MRIALYTDVHFSEFSSIIRSMGEHYSTRLENLIKSVNWAEKLADEYNCDQIFCLGDFFDKPELNSAELTALKEIKWSSKPHKFLVGNHEGSVRSLKYNSTWALEGRGFDIISEPKYIELDNCVLVFIPYILEADRKPLKEYIPETNKDIYVFSHNDIAGIQYGAIESKEGFKVDEIRQNCDLFLNGHLHNGGQFAAFRGFNIGNLTGQNFNEDALKYVHPVFILNTDSGAIETYENPYAFNFYQFEIYKEKDLEKLDQIKPYSVLQIKYAESIKDKLDLKLASLSSRIVASRLLVVRDSHIVDDSALQQIQTVNHLKQFCDFSIEALGNSQILQNELAKILA